MLLCIDIGNTHIFGGIYHDERIQLQFRYPSSTPTTSDQLGIFFKTVLKENEINPKAINKIAICSVVPAIDYTIRAAFLKYFEIDPFFLNVNNVKSIKISYKNVHEIGADRISSSIAAIHKYPQQNIIVIDLGTATTFDIINADKEYLGGLIIPGIYISMKSLSENTAKLSTVNIVKPEKILGDSTITNIQAGLYYSQIGAAREIVKRISQSVFQNQKYFVIGTGGFANLFEGEQLFNVIVPELVLDGLNIASSF